MKYLVHFARCICILLICGLLAGCGYRAPMYKTVVTEDPDTYSSVRGEYRELAALLASDTGMPPTDSNTLSVLPEARQKFNLLLDDLRRAEESVYIEYYRVRLDSIGTAVTDILKDKAHSGNAGRRAPLVCVAQASQLACPRPGRGDFIRRPSRREMLRRRAPSHFSM